MTRRVLSVGQTNFSCLELAVHHATSVLHDDTIVVTTHVLIKMIKRCLMVVLKHLPL